jgi:hypothetical protein
MDAKAMTDAELLAELEKASDIQVELAALHAELKRRFGACYMARHLNELREEKARREAAESFQPGDRVCHKSVVWDINGVAQAIVMVVRDATADSVTASWVAADGSYHAREYLPVELRKVDWGGKSAPRGDGES